MSFRQEMGRRKLLATRIQDGQAAATGMLKATPCVRFEAKALSSQKAVPLLQKIKEGKDLEELSPIMDIRLLKCVNKGENLIEAAEIIQTIPDIPLDSAPSTETVFVSPYASAIESERKKVRLKSMQDLLEVFPEKSCDEFLYECIPQILTTNSLKDSANFFHRRHQNTASEDRFSFADVFAEYPAEKQNIESSRKSAAASGSIEDELAATIPTKTTKCALSSRFNMDFDYQGVIASSIHDVESLRQASLAFQSALGRFHAQDLATFSKPENLVTFEAIQQHHWWSAASRYATAASLSASSVASASESKSLTLKQDGADSSAMLELENSHDIMRAGEEDSQHEGSTPSIPPSNELSEQVGVGDLIESTGANRSHNGSKLVTDQEPLSPEEITQAGIVADLYAKACKVLCTPIIGWLHKQPFAHVVNVSHLSLGNNGISSLAVIIMNSSRIELLDIFNNGISHVGVKHLCSSLLESETIRELRLDCNPLGLKGAMQLSGALCCNRLNTSIETLSLSGCKLGDTGSAQIFKSLLGAMNMKCLNLSANAAEIETAKAAADVLPLITGLERLSLRWNYFRGSAAVVFCQGAMNNRSITDMDLSWNAFGEVGAVSHLGEALKVMNHLKSLDVSYNRLDERGAYILGSALEINHHISFCNFSGNPVGMLGARSLFQLIMATGAESTAKGGRRIKLENCNIQHVDCSVFDSSKSDGKYQLDLSDNYSRIVMGNILRMRDSNRGEILEGSIKMNGENVSKMTWNEATIPKSGFMQFQFESIHHFPPTVEDCISSKNMASIKDLLCACPDEKQRFALFEMSTGNEAYFSKDQVTDIFKMFHDSAHRVALISLLSFQMAPAKDASILKQMLSREELDSQSIATSKFVRDFTNMNATGHYRLNLDNNDDRRLMEHLFRMRSGVKQRRKHWLVTHKHRFNRDLEWCIRNVKWNGKDCQIHPGWMPPSQGMLEFDFTADVCQRSSSLPIEHTDFCNRMSQIECEKERTELLRQLSNTFSFRTETALCFLETISSPQNLEDCVITFFNSIFETMGFQYLLSSIGPTCRDNVIRSLGIHNCWCERCAVAYYVLDLSNAEHRFVCQQLIALSMSEPGESIVDEHYENKSFSVPEHWQEAVPFKGIVTFFYCREQAVLDALYSSFEQSSLDLVVWKSFQPVGVEWVHARKRGIIKDRIKEKFPNPETAFQSMDRDGGGSLSRVELSTDLRKLGIWLQVMQQRVCFWDFGLRFRVLGC